MRQSPRQSPHSLSFQHDKFDISVVVASLQRGREIYLVTAGGYESHASDPTGERDDYQNFLENERLSKHQSSLTAGTGNTDREAQ